MKVDEAIEVLTSIQKDGGGDLPLQLMVIECGVTHAEDAVIMKAEEEKDGHRVWIYGGKRHSPEWLHK